MKPGKVLAEWFHMVETPFWSALERGKTQADWWGQPTPLKNMSLSIGMMNFPTEWENNIHVPNHQAAYHN